MYDQCRVGIDVHLDVEFLPTHRLVFEAKNVVCDAVSTGGNQGEKEKTGHPRLLILKTWVS